MTEEQKKDIAEKKAAYLAAIQTQLKKEASIAESVAMTEPGMKFLRMLHDKCGFAKADRVIRADGQIDPVATALNAERRNVYLEIRVLLSAEMRREIENPIVTEEKK